MRRAAELGVHERLREPLHRRDLAEAVAASWQLPRNDGKAMRSGLPMQTSPQSIIGMIVPAAARLRVAVGQWQSFAFCLTMPTSSRDAAPTSQ